MKLVSVSVGHCSRELRRSSLSPLGAQCGNWRELRVEDAIASPFPVEVRPHARSNHRVFHDRRVAVGDRRIAAYDRRVVERIEELTTPTFFLHGTGGRDI